MIICFSGTGNTARCARKLAAILDEEFLLLDGENLTDPEACPIPEVSGRVIWAFPTYSWGVPPVMTDYITKVRADESVSRVPHYMLTTCGDDIGQTDRVWRRLVARRGWHPKAEYSVIMPNTYVAMPGFNVDPPEVAERKLLEAEDRINEIARLIRSGADTRLLHPGAFSFIKTAVVYPWFRRFGMSPRPFRSNEGCIGCGKCVQACPLQNIRMTDSRPRWSKTCALCLRCYHICPRRAVAYGSSTDGKGQWQGSMSFLSQ